MGKKDNMAGTRFAPDNQITLLQNGETCFPVLEALFDCAELMTKQPRPRGERLAILTNGGGPGVMAAVNTLNEAVIPTYETPDQTVPRYDYAVCVVNEYRIRKFKLDQFVDFFISSCFVHVRKLDADIFRFALDMAQTSAEQVVSIDDQPLFVAVAERLRIQGIHHKNYRSTRAQLALTGLQNNEEANHGIS